MKQQTLNSKHRIALCGCGSLGSNFALTLGRRLSQEIGFYLIDDDKIEEKNLSNQPWFDINIGQSKVNVLSANLWHISKTTSICINRRIENINDSSLFPKEIDLIVDCFDNHKSRKIVNDIAEIINIPIVHAGFSENSFQCGWKMITSKDNNREPICDRRELAEIVSIGSAILSKTVYFFLDMHKKLSYYLSIQNEEIKIVKI